MRTALQGNQLIDTMRRQVQQLVHSLAQTVGARLSPHLDEPSSAGHDDVHVDLTGLNPLGSSDRGGCSATIPRSSPPQNPTRNNYWNNAVHTQMLEASKTATKLPVIDAVRVPHRLG